MNIKQFDEQIEKAQKSLTKSILTYDRNRESLARIIGVCSLGFPNVEPTVGESSVVYSVWNVKTFKSVEPVMSALEFIGVELDKWSTTDYPESRNRDFHNNLNGVRITIAMYADSKDSACRLVETGEKVVKEYRMECDE